LLVVAEKTRAPPAAKIKATQRDPRVRLAARTMARTVLQPSRGTAFIPLSKK
jgi:hypothetical protein